MRKPINKGTARKPLYGGVAQRYTAADGSKGHQVQVPGWYTNMSDYEAAVRAAFAAYQERLDREASAKITSKDLTVKEHVTRDWLEMNPRGKEASNRKLAGTPHEQDDGTVLRLAGDIKPLWMEFGDLRLRELDDDDHYRMRKWAGKQPKRVIEAARVWWNEMCADLGMVRANPFQSLGRPNSRGRGGKNITVLTEAEVELLCECAREAHPGPLGHSVAGLIRYCAETGVRPGEAMATEHSWLDHRHGEAQVFPDVRDPKTGELLGKTVDATRTIYVPQAAWDALAHIEPINPIYVFWAPRGGRFTASSWDRYWKATRTLFMDKLDRDHHLWRRVQRMQQAGQDPSGNREEGQGHLVLYELRHYACTRWLNEGYAHGQDVARMIAHQLGHKNGDPRLVYDTYGHPDQKLARAALRRLDEQRMADTVRSLDEQRRRHAADQAS